MQAADVPPISNLRNFTQMGFDLVTFSGGKGIRGPQNAGQLLGRKELIAATASSNNPFDDCVGRGMKVAKEQIVGMVAAVDWFLSQSDEGLRAEFERRADRIAAHLKDVPTLECRTVVPPGVFVDDDVRDGGASRNRDGKRECHEQTTEHTGSVWR